MYSQGCSDAGVCSLDIMNETSTHNSEQLYNNTLQFGIGYGIADNNINVFNSFLEYSFNLQDFSFDFKGTILSQNGSDYNSFGLGDVYFTGSYKLSQNSIVSLGMKLSLNNADNTTDITAFNGKRLEITLPMDYQTSLGTTDLILAYSHKIDNFSIFSALQVPITQNKNMFDSTKAASQRDKEFSEFTSTTNFQRSSDLIIRINYLYKVNEDIDFVPSILPIYHLSNDKYSEFTGNTEVIREIEGSDGLTLNLNLQSKLKLDNSFITLNIGFPVLVRKVRPDGLTRALVLGLNYGYNF